MKRAAWILAVLFGAIFLGAVLMNVSLVAKSRKAFTGGVFRETSSIPRARYHLVLALPDDDDSFFSGLVEGVRAGASEADAAVQVFRYSASSRAEADRYFEIAIGAGVDGFIMYAPLGDPVMERAERAARSGVVFVPVGTDLPEGRPRGFIGSASLLQGFEGGKRICAALGASARVGVILPANGTGPEKEEPLYRGLSASLKAFPGASVVALSRARPGTLAGEEAASAMLGSNPSINAIFCANSRDTIGVAQVVVDLNRVGSVLVIGADETPEILRYIEKGVVAASIVRDSKWIGREAVRAFARIKDGKAALSPIEAGFYVRTAQGKAP
jgi:ribose transport system substrate-binding protein